MLRGLEDKEAKKTQSRSAFGNHTSTISKTVFAVADRGGMRGCIPLPAHSNFCTWKIPL